LKNIYDLLATKKNIDEQHMFKKTYKD